MKLICHCAAETGICGNLTYPCKWKKSLSITSKVIQECMDGRSPVLCQSLFPCWCVFPLTSLTWHGSIPAFFLLPTRSVSNKTCLLINTTGCFTQHRDQDFWVKLGFLCLFLLLWDVAMLLTAPTTGKRRGETEKFSISCFEGLPPINHGFCLLLVHKDVWASLCRIASLEIYFSGSPAWEGEFRTVLKPVVV